MISAINSAIQERKPCFIHLETKRLSSHSKSDDNRDDKFIETLFVDDILHNKLSEGAMSYDDDYIVEIKNLFDEVIKSPDSFYEETEQDVHTFEDNVEIVNTGQKFIEHINESLRDFLTKNESSVLIGEDIEDDPFMSGKIYGGAFKATKGLSTLFPKRVLNMPISESGFTGFAAGIALRGQYTIVEIMFADFLSQNFDQIFHQIAKIPSIYGAKTDLPIFIRTAGFSGNGYGPTHSESMENIYFGLPNLDIYVPNVFSSYENILNEFKYGKKPTLVIEPKALYNNKVDDKIYSEYSLTNDNFITQLKPKTRKPSVTILTMGPQLDLLVSNLEYLAKEYEIYINIFSPIKLNNIDTGTLGTSVGESGNNIIAFSNSLGYSSIFDHWISELLKVTKINKYKSTKMRNWIPTSKSEKNILPNMEELISIIESINE
jgi:pyruvate/2-oxoglutarate/acetoin dehydrogenase E1 component